MGIRIEKAQNPYNGIPPENLFYCVNDLNQYVSFGSVIPLNQSLIYPKRPLNLYMNIQSLIPNMQRPVPGREILLGALLVRANALRDSQPQRVPTRLFARLLPNDSEMIDFYRNAGFDVNSGFCQLCSIQLPGSHVTTKPMDYQIKPYQLKDAADLSKHYAYLRQTQRVSMSLQEFSQSCRNPVSRFFTVVHLKQGEQTVVGEAYFTSQNPTQAILMYLYMQPMYRGKNLEEALLYQAMIQLKNENGIQQFFAYMETNIPCEKEISNTNAKPEKTIYCYPERLYD